MDHHTREIVPTVTPADDKGFTLVEVIWALFLLGLIAMAALGFFTSGLKNVAHVQRQQAAVSLANSAMDLARSVPPGSTDASGTSGLLRGRNQADVTATWNAASSAEPSDTADMTMAWDHQPGVTTAQQWVPVTTTATVDNQNYTIDTLIGECWRLKAASTTSQNCIGTDPHSTDYMLMYRVRVVVRWDESSDGSAKYTYRLSSLVDPSADATWNTVLKPYAYDDEVLATVGDNSCINIVTNDTVNYDTSISPAAVVTDPASGTVTAGGSACPTGMFFKPGAYSGLTSFTYHVTDKAHDTSPPATVTVHMLPKPVAKTIFVSGTGISDITSKMTDGDPGFANLDSATRVTAVVPILDESYNPFDTATSPGVGDISNLATNGISMSGGKVMFDPSKSPNGVSFFYYLVDRPTSGDAASYHSENYAQVTIKVDPPTSVTDGTYKYDATASAVPETIDFNGLTGNDPASKIVVTGVSAETSPTLTQGQIDDHVWVDSAKWNSTSGKIGSALVFRHDSTIGVFTITYKAVAPSGAVTTSTGTITVTVYPSVVGSYSTNISSTSTATVDLAKAGIVPLTNVEGVELSASGGCSLGGAIQTNGLKVNVTGINRRSTCTVSYALQSTSLAEPLTSRAYGSYVISRGRQ